MELTIKVKDINKLDPIDVAVIMSRLSWPDSQSDSSIQKELTKRYQNATPGPHPEMALAIIAVDAKIIGWVGSRLWPEKFKGRPVMAQTIECFVDPAYRRRGIARLGLQALLTAKKVDHAQPVSVYAPEVVSIARACGCKIVLLCEP